MDLSVVPYSHISPSESECAAANHSKDNINSNNNATKVEKNGHGRVVDPVEAPQKPAKNAGIRYRECLRNHAASIGGHANDGCGEFMPAGGDGTIEALKCAACGCHRNFHRKEVSGCEYPVQAGFCYNAGPGWDYSGKKKMGFPALPPILPHIKMDLQQRSQSAVENKNSEEQDQAAAIAARKRFRTKFTNEQKDKMLAFAEKLGWRIQKHDDVALQQFCMEVGVKRHVLKVWMHNNKNTLGKKETLSV